MTIENRPSLASLCRDRFAVILHMRASPGKVVENGPEGTHTRPPPPRVQDGRVRRQASAPLGIDDLVDLIILQKRPARSSTCRKEQPKTQATTRVARQPHATHSIRACVYCRNCALNSTVIGSMGRVALSAATPGNAFHHCIPYGAPYTPGFVERTGVGTPRREETSGSGSTCELCRAK